ncbi:unannotated protein [freshwater metagenome]|uniref:Unannotated protein n=1 Tax=freshwater metagenome TaxID=449393 RepID=A0A6J7HKL0_9ZZZZ
MHHECQHVFCPADAIQASIDRDFGGDVEAAPEELAHDCNDLRLIVGSGQVEDGEVDGHLGGRQHLLVRPLGGVGVPRAQ